MNCKKQDSLKKRRWNTSSKTFEQPSFTEAPPLGPRWDSAPPRISHRVRFQGGRRRREKFIHLISYLKGNFQNGKREKFGKTIKADIPGGQLLRAPNSQRPPRATKARWLAIFGKNPPAPSGTEHWILGHQGLQPRALTKIYAWASRRGVPLILWHVSPPATNRNAYILAKFTKFKWKCV